MKSARPMPKPKMTFSNEDSLPRKRIAFIISRLAKKGPRISAIRYEYNSKDI
jgi:hypothetical protein